MLACRSCQGRLQGVDAAACLAVGLDEAADVGILLSKLMAIDAHGVLVGLVERDDHGGGLPRGVGSEGVHQPQPIFRVAALGVFAARQHQQVDAALGRCRASRGFGESLHG